MLIDDDVVTQRKAEAGSLACRLRRKEWIEHPFLHLGRDAGAVVTNLNFDAVAEVLGRGCECGFVVVSNSFRFALCGRIEAVGD
jgi:hypothetical protein